MKAGRITSIGTDGRVGVVLDLSTGIEYPFRSGKLVGLSDLVAFEEVEEGIAGRTVQFAKVVDSNG